MQFHPIERAKHIIKRNGAALRDGALLASFMVVATWVAYQYDIFANAPGVPTQQNVVELDEALGLVGLLFVGLLILSWRLLISQRREVARRVTAEQRARELAHQDSLTGLPNRRQFEHELKAAIAAPPRTDGAHALFLLDLDGFKR